LFQEDLNMAITIYNTQTLIQVQQRLADLPDGFWRRLYNRVVTSDREEIMFEALDTPQRKLAPFVAPNVQGRVIRGQGFSARTFAPAYVKPKSVIEPSKAIRRTFGEAIGGSLSQAQRFDIHVTQSLRTQREMIERRWDWMAAMATIYGEVTVSGQDYPTQTIDFGRDASLTEVLAGAARWDQTGSDPLGDLQTKVTASFDLGTAPITDLVFGTGAWSAFITDHDDVIELLDNTQRGSTSEFSRTGLNQVGSNYQLMGQVSSTQGGNFNLWRYNNWYHDVNEETGEISVAYFLDSRDVVGYGPALDGVAAFGAIQDVDAGFLVETDMFPKQWKNEDPSVVYTMTQSAPLFVPTNPNNSFRLRVIS
jgi:hypothetical protein